MEIMKDYELRRCGSQVVFRRFAEPSGQFETVFVADEVVKTDIPGLTVLKQGFNTYALLREKGYEIRAITPVDLFPRTGHVECVVLMSRKEK